MSCGDDDETEHDGDEAVVVTVVDLCEGFSLVLENDDVYAVVDETDEAAAGHVLPFERSG